MVCLHSSPKKRSGVSSLITKGEKWCVFVYHQRQNSAVSSPPPTKKQKYVFVYHELWETGVFAHYQRRKNGLSSFITYDGTAVCSPITNEETVVCLRLSPTMDKYFVSPCNEGRKEQRDPYIIICHMISQHHLLFRITRSIGRCIQTWNL
jgi:hypothetical protein